MDLLLAADKYNIPDLVKICMNHLKTNLTEVNAVDIMSKSYMINQKDLFDAARKFVQFCKNRSGSCHFDRASNDEFSVEF